MDEAVGALRQPLCQEPGPLWPWPFQQLIELQHSECQLNKHISGKQKWQRERRSVIAIKPLEVNTCSCSRRPRPDIGWWSEGGGAAACAFARECVCVSAHAEVKRGGGSWTRRLVRAVSLAAPLMSSTVRTAVGGVWGVGFQGSPGEVGRLVGWKRPPDWPA